jgi:hypothetical protein
VPRNFRLLERGEKGLSDGMDVFMRSWTAAIIGPLNVRLLLLLPN